MRKIRFRSSFNAFELFKSLEQGQCDVLPLLIHVKTKREQRYSFRFSIVNSGVYCLKRIIFCFFVVHPTLAYFHSLTHYKIFSNTSLWPDPFFPLYYHCCYYYYQYKKKIRHLLGVCVSATCCHGDTFIIICYIKQVDAGLEFSQVWLWQHQ